MSEKLRKKLIYVLDDDEAILILMNKLLTNLGLEVETFLSADFFVNALKNKIPDLCFIDLNLGTHLGAGFQLTQALRKKLLDKIKLIVISSRDSATDITHALEIGFDDYIIKPINKNVLEAKLKQHLSEVLDETIPLKPTPKEFENCKMTLDSYLYSINEHEFTILTQHLLPQNAEVLFETGTLFNIIQKKITLPVYYHWRHVESGLNAATFHFPEDDLELRNTILKWLIDNPMEAVPQKNS